MERMIPTMYSHFIWGEGADMKETQGYESKKWLRVFVGAAESNELDQR